MKYVPWKDYKAVTADLNSISQSVTEEETLQSLELFGERWDDKYPQISRSWRAHWGNLNTLFKYPKDIRKAIYTTNAIESLNSVIRRPLENVSCFQRMTQPKKLFIWQHKMRLKNGLCQ